MLEEEWEKTYKKWCSGMVEGIDMYNGKKVAYTDANDWQEIHDMGIASAQAVREEKEQIKLEMDRDEEAALQQAKNELVSNHESLILKMLQASYNAQMDFGQYCDSVVYPMIDAQIQESEM